MSTASQGVVGWINTTQVIAQSFEDDKAAGLHDIQPIVLKNLDAAYYNCLTLLFQAYISLLIILTAWIIMEVLLIPKVGKSQYTELRAYKPILLNSEGNVCRSLFEDLSLGVMLDKRITRSQEASTSRNNLPRASQLVIMLIINQLALMQQS